MSGNTTRTLGLSLIQAVRTLDFYANQNNWNKVDGHSQIDADLTPIRQDHGKKAKEALDEIERILNESGQS